MGMTKIDKNWQRDLRAFEDECSAKYHNMLLHGQDIKSDCLDKMQKNIQVNMILFGQRLTICCGI